MRLCLHPKYEYLCNWITALPDTFSTQGEIIYNARNQIRVIGEWNVKRYCQPLWVNRIAYLFRKTKAQRAYENAVHLQELSVTTPEPIGYLLTYKCGLLAESYLITRQANFPHRMYDMGEKPFTETKALFAAFARYTAELHNKGVYHRDYSPGNILYREEDGIYQFCLVDINRMSFGKISLTVGCRNLCRLWGTEESIRYLAENYAEARGVNKATCVRLTLKYWNLFWKNRKKPFEA